MSVEELEFAIQKLPADEFKRLASWFAEYEAEQWDRQIEADQRTGRLDHVIKRVRANVAASRRL
jgi:hypothetical protein